MQYSPPQSPAALVGRERETAAIVDLLRRPKVRLLALTGSGGIGKTRLAVQVASQLLDEYAGGAYFVSLAPVSDPRLVPSTLASALGVKEVGALAAQGQLERAARLWGAAQAMHEPVYDSAV